MTNLKKFSKNCLIKAEEAELEADKMAYKLITITEIFNNISIFQSMCDFNLYWLYQISPEVFIHLKTIKFLIKNIKKFKRKITIKEIIYCDLIICRNKDITWAKFKKFYI